MLSASWASHELDDFEWKFLCKAFFMHFFWQPSSTQVLIFCQSFLGWSHQTKSPFNLVIYFFTYFGAYSPMTALLSFYFVSLSSCCFPIINSISVVFISFHKLPAAVFCMKISRNLFAYAHDFLHRHLCFFLIYCWIWAQICTH